MSQTPHSPSATVFGHHVAGKYVATRILQADAVAIATTTITGIATRNRWESCAALATAAAITAVRIRYIVYKLVVT